MTHSNSLPPANEIACDCLAARLRLLNRVVTKLYDDALRPHGIRVSQMNILVAIAATGPLRAADVSRRLRMDASTLSRDLERLLARKWVRSLPGRGRSRPLEVTAAGRKLLARLLDDWRAAQRQARELLPPAFAGEIARAVDALWAGDGRE
jgi:DNA-binding MarR family transcriptional regulator